MRRRTLIATACFLGLAGCVLPARSYGAFEEKAATTAQAAISAIETAQLAIRVAQEHRAFAASIAVTLDEAENDASSAQSTLGSIQPPDNRSRAVSDELDSILDPAIKVLTDLRIDARADRLDELARGEAPLHAATDKLTAFLEAHR
jgi:hypothetical protein